MPLTSPLKSPLRANIFDSTKRLVMLSCDSVQWSLLISTDVSTFQQCVYSLEYAYLCIYVNIEAVNIIEIPTLL